tara:strand:- start:22580 stop:24328 length:1749 start_codon:yes stop_codon:yes gene_type:complete
MELVDRVTSPVRRIQQSLSGLARRAGLDRLTGAVRRVGNAMSGAVGKARALGERMVIMGGLAAGAVWGVERLVSGVTDVGTSVKESAERLSVGTTWLQEWMAVGKKFGVGNDALVDGLKELAMRADEFVMTAGGPAAEAFGRLGIGVDELRKTGGDTAAMFDLVRSRLGGLENDAARQRVMDEIFGGQGAEQMVEMLGATREEIEAIMRAARERGSIMSPEEIENSREYNREMGSFRDSLFGIQRTVVGDLLPAINDWLDRMRELATANREAVATEIVDGIRDIWGGIKRIGEIVGWAAEKVGGFGNLLLVLAGLLSLTFVAAIGQALLALSSLSVALLTTPAGWFLLAVGLIAGAAYLIYKNWDGISAWIGDMWDSITAFFDQGILDITLAILSWTPAGLFLRGIDAVIEAFTGTSLIDTGREWIGGLWDGIQETWASTTAWVDDSLVRLQTAYANFSLVDTGRDLISGLWDGIEARWDQLTAWLDRKMQDLTGWLPDWAQDGLGLKGMGAPATGGSPAAALGAPVSQSGGNVLGVQDRRTEVGGELRIVIDSEGRPRVAEVRRDGALDFDVDAGVLGMNP